MFIRTQENSLGGRVGRAGGNNLTKRLQTTHVRMDVGGEAEEEEGKGRGFNKSVPGVLHMETRWCKHTDEAAAAAASGSGFIFWPILIKPQSRLLAR